MNKLREQLGGETLWGLPKNISDELVDSYQSTLFRWLGFWLFMIVMVGGFAVGAIIWGKAENIIEKNAEVAANSVNGFAIDTNFGIGLLIGLFVWIFLSSVIVSLVIRLFPMPAKAALFFGGNIDPQKVDPKAFNKKVSFLDSSIKPRNASEFLNQYLDRTIAKSIKILMPFVILVVAVCYAELHSFSVFSPTGFHKSGFFSKDMTVRTWQDVQTVKLGCNQTDDGPDLIYEVSWPDGKHKRLPIDTHINAENWLTNIEAVDAVISKSGAAFIRWKWNNRNPLHPKCLRGFYADLSQGEKTRFDRLLRKGEIDWQNDSRQTNSLR